MDRFFDNFRSFTIFVSRVTFTVNLMGSLILLLIGISMKISQQLVRPSDVDIFIIVKSDVGVLFIVLASVNTFLNTIHFVLIIREVIACIYLDMFLLIASIALKIVSLNSPEKVVPMFVRKSSLIKDFSSEDIKFDTNNTILLPEDNFARSWALVQMNMMCCGLSGPKDYQLLESHQRQGLRPLTPASKTPLSCCSLERMNLDVDMDRNLLEECRLNKLRVHQKGCFEVIWKSMKLTDGVVRFIIIVLIVTEAILMDLLWRTLRWRQYELGR